MQTYREVNCNLKEHTGLASEQKVRPKHVTSADYMADMILEMRNLAKSGGQRTLQGLLEIAYYEAFALANPVELTAAEREKLRELESYAKSVISAGNQ